MEGRVKKTKVDEITGHILQAIQQQGGTGAPVIANIMSYLTIHEMYVVGGKPGIREYFEANNMWKHIAGLKYGQKWIEEHEGYLLSVKGLIPSGKRINYLWLMAAHWAVVYLAHYDPAEANIFHLRASKTIELILPGHRVITLMEHRDFEQPFPIVLGNKRLEINTNNSTLYIHIILQIVKNSKNFEEINLNKMGGFTITLNKPLYSHANAIRIIYGLMVSVPGLSIKDAENRNEPIREELAF